MSRFAALVVAQLALAGLATVAVRRGQPDRPLVVGLAATLSLAFPLLGPCAAWWLLGRERRAGWRDDLPEPPTPMPAAVNVEALLTRELAVRPLTDQLRGGTRAVRQAAARTLTELGNADAVRVLEGALVDADADTRLYASIALVKLEASFAERLAAARAGVSPILRCRAVRAYLNSGLPRGSAAAALWQELAEAAGLATTLPGAGVEAWLHLAAARRALGDLPGARSAAEQALARGEAPPAALELCQALWEAGEVTDLAAAAATLGRVSPPGSTAHQAASFWQ